MEQVIKEVNKTIEKKESVNNNLDNKFILDNMNTFNENIKKLLNENMSLKIENKRLKNEINQKDNQIEHIIEQTKILKKLIDEKRWVKDEIHKDTELNNNVEIIITNDKD